MLPSNDFTTQQTRYISHEIKNQLSICDVYCEVIRKHLLNNNIKNDSIERALNCIQKSGKLIANSLLDLKSLTNITPENVWINRLIEESIDLGEAYIFDKKIEIKYNVGEDTLIYIDPNKLQACILNIIKNAIEAIDSEGTIKIKTETSKETLRILISNTGKIISKSERNKIFKDGHTTKKHGSGIGLYWARKTLIDQGANLKLTDNPYTEFEISINLQK